jgi:hypothetical protein
MTTPTDPTRTDPTDPLPPEEFSSWQSALEQSRLKPAQVICSNSNAHKSRSDNCWSPTKDEKDAFVKILFSN